MQLSSLMKIKPSATVAINSLALEKKSRGERVYNLSAGEPMVDTDKVIIEAAEKAMKEGKTHYPPVAGIPELRATFSTWMNVAYQTAYAPEQCVVTCGGKFGIFALCQALLNPSDEVLIPAPYWVSYPEMVKLFGGVPKIVMATEEKGWKVSVEDLEKQRTLKTKVLIINNGGNPTGVLYGRSELESLLNFAKQHNLVVISDEVYSGLTYDKEEYVSCGSFSEYQDRVIVIQSCSKHFAMTGWRVGFALGPKEIIKALTLIQGQSTTGTSSISQWAALSAIGNAKSIVPIVNDSMRKRRDALVKELSEYFPGPFISPHAGLYMFIALKTLGVETADSARFCEEILRQGNVAMVPGAAFGQEGYVRLSFGESESELREAVGVLRVIIDKKLKD